VTGLSIVDTAARRPDHPGVVVDDKPLWFADLADRALVCAAGLYEAGADELAIVGRSDLDTVVALYAALEFGIPTALIHARLPAVERDALLARTPDAFVIDSARGLPRPHRPVPLDRLAPPLDSDIAFTIYTSGTSGRARGVLLSRSALLASGEASAANLTWRDDDRWLCCLPLAHVGGLSILTRCLGAGATVVLGPPRDLGPQIERHRVTLLSVVPALLERLCDDAEAGADVSSLRAVLVGGAACPPTLLARARANGIPALLTYGMTETASQIATAPFAHALSLVDDADWPPPLPLLPGVEVRIGDNRRIAVRGPMLMSGYAAPDHRPPAIAPRSDHSNDGGWFETGDLGRLATVDGAKALVVLGRADNVIITGGENVMPQEVEAALRAHPQVAQACVVGLPDPAWGMVVVAAVAGPRPPAKEHLDEHLTPRLASFKRPRAYVHFESLPLTASGKVDRAAVAAELARRLQAE